MTFRAVPHVKKTLYHWDTHKMQGVIRCLLHMYSIVPKICILGMPYVLPFFVYQNFLDKKSEILNI